MAGHKVKIKKLPPHIESKHEKRKDSITFRHSITLPTMLDGNLEFVKKAVALAKKLCEDEEIPLSEKKMYYAKKVYPTASVYEGQWKHSNWNGHGDYHFPHGVRIIGNFHDSRLHGLATLKYPAGQQLETVWDHDELLYWNYKFADGLYYTDPWYFCQFPDRRYVETHKDGFAAPGEERLTTKTQERAIPPGCFDAGEGFYDSQLHCIVDATDTTKIIRIPTREEEKKILKHCRTFEEKPIGYCPELYEFWTNGTKKSVKEMKERVCGKNKRGTVIFNN